MLMLILTLVTHGAELEAAPPHTPHVEVAGTASNGPTRPYAGIGGGWDGRVHLLGRAELWPHTEARELEAIDIDVRRPIARGRARVQSGVDVIEGIRLAAITEISHGEGRPYPEGEPDRGTVVWGGVHAAFGPTIDAWRVRGVGEIQFSPAVNTGLGRMRGIEWRTWLDVDAHLGQLVVTTALGAGKTSWRLANSGTTHGLRPLARVTIGKRF